MANGRVAARLEMGYEVSITLAVRRTREDPVTRGKPNELEVSLEANESIQVAATHESPKSNLSRPTFEWLIFGTGPKHAHPHRARRHPLTHLGGELVGQGPWMDRRAEVAQETPVSCSVAL